MTLATAFLMAFDWQPNLASAADPGITNEAFRATWSRTDLPIINGKTSRSWYWGPKPLSISFQENYKESPGGKREIQFFDKARMEINDPSKGIVTNGLLVVELITGKRQDGDNTFTDVGAAQVAVAGDADNPFPTYAGLKSVYMKNLDMNPGEVVLSSLTDKGVGEQQAHKTDPATKIATKQNGLGIPAAFWEFLNRKGVVSVNGELRDDVISSWLFSTGLPITEAYWTRVRVGGVEKDVMLQAFERRVLTYTPANSLEFRVEMGNVGWHYLTWRYPKGVPQTVDPLGAIFTGPQPDWYEITADALNIRTAPNTQASRPERTETKPFLQTLLKGNHIQPIRTVKGEELEKGNNDWFQIYENPDLFAYSGYAKKATLPAYPTPPRTYKGLWVSVDLTKQMLAVFENDRLLYKTWIASGVPNDQDPDKDHRTPAGVYKIIGSYRPLSQTMQGGEGDRAAGGDFYKLEDVRNVSYFFEDYSIHGTYWHARFGTYPQSHGCVNATVYDASLIYKLKAGTTVDVFREGSASPSRLDW